MPNITTEIQKILFNYKKKIHSIFHFGEFARIYQSFKKFDNCFKANIIGTNAVFKFGFCINVFSSIFVVVVVIRRFRQ